MNGSHRVAAALCAVLAAASSAAGADALSVLNDAAVFAKVQKDVAEAQRADLDALNETVATCSAASIGQRAQQFECERSVNLYWAHYARGRSLDDYIGALGGLFAAFDNNALNPTPEMMQTYRHASNDLVSLTKAINKRYRQLEK
ncbi:MAG: hypothetical protein ISP90_05855 [Nevskia sp.]|nr:hypothetical protein [Nevskia sp.]